MGRSAEISITRYEESYYDYEYEMWCLLWPEIKTNNIKVVPFSHDIDTLEIDIYHSLGCSWIVGFNSNSDGDNAEYIWPDLKDLGDGALSKINDYLQALVAKVEELPKNVQGKSIRRGATNDLIATMGVEKTLRFGNWDNGYCSILEYYDILDEERIQCAKRLAGFKLDEKCFPPRL